MCLAPVCIMSQRIAHSFLTVSFITTFLSDTVAYNTTFCSDTVSFITVFLSGNDSFITTSYLIVLYITTVVSDTVSCITKTRIYAAESIYISHFVNNLNCVIKVW